MKIFPSKTYKVELTSDYSVLMEKLRSITDITESLISQRTEKAFRGQVSKNGFKVISSEIGRGALCVMIGNFKGNKGEIEIRLNSGFKVLSSILFSYPFIGLGLVTYQQGIEEGIRFLPVFIILILFLRYVFLELSFRFVSHTGINKLKKVLGIRELMRK